MVELCHRVANQPGRPPILRLPHGDSAAMTKHNIAALSYVLGMHLDRISRLMCGSKDGYLDLTREVRFFVVLGYRKYLKGNKEFDSLWSKYPGTCPDNMVVQDWKLDRDLAVLEIACGVYTSKGILVKSELAWDTVEFGGEEEAEGVLA